MTRTIILTGALQARVRAQRRAETCSPWGEGILRKYQLGETVMRLDRLIEKLIRG